MTIIASTELILIQTMCSSKLRMDFFHSGKHIMDIILLIRRVMLGAPSLWEIICKWPALWCCRVINKSSYQNEKWNFKNERVSIRVVDFWQACHETPMTLKCHFLSMAICQGFLPFCHLTIHSPCALLQHPRVSLSAFCSHILWSWRTRKRTDSWSNTRRRGSILSETYRDEVGLIAEKFQELFSLPACLLLSSAPFPCKAASFSREEVTWVWKRWRISWWSGWIACLHLRMDGRKTCSLSCKVV